MDVLRFLALIGMALVWALASAQTPPLATGQGQGAVANASMREAIGSLSAIEQSLQAKRKVIRELERQLKFVQQPSEKQELEQKIEKAGKDIAGLQRSFDQIALGGIDISVVSDQPQQKINWREELEQITMPILASLKELTDKPRQVEKLRSEINRHEDHLKVIRKALASAQSFKNQTLPPGVAKSIDRLADDWQQREAETERALQIAQVQLADLLGEDVSWLDAVNEALAEFLQGRGLTLLLAVASGTVVWLVTKVLLEAYRRWPLRARGKKGVTRGRLVLYGYRLLTAVGVVLALLIVFYVRGDLLLLALTVIALITVGLSLRQAVPRYVAEMRLLLGVGPVREDERVVLDGVPLKVVSINIYSVLRNPELEGVARLPLRALNDLVSRPVGNEPWFPCKPDDYVLLADGSFGRVLRQTIELVELQVRNSVRQIRTADFLGESVHNLSRQGFGAFTTFGIDYQHQAICLDTVPGCLREAIAVTFERADLAGDIEDILVEFKKAGASSLDYLIYVTVNGRAAGSYFKLERLIQQACVDTCNREGWIIPFTQVTVHQG